MKTCENCLKHGLEAEMDLHEAGMSIVNRHSQYLLECKFCKIYCFSVDGKEFKYTFEFDELTEEMKSTIKKWEAMWEGHRKELLKRIKAEDEIDFVNRLRKMVESIENPLAPFTLRSHDLVRLFETLEGKLKAPTD